MPRLQLGSIERSIAVEARRHLAASVEPPRAPSDWRRLDPLPSLLPEGLPGQSTPQSNRGSWDAVMSLHPGTYVEVSTDTNPKAVKGRLEKVDGDTVTVDVSRKDVQTLQQKTVKVVRVKPHPGAGLTGLILAIVGTGVVSFAGYSTTTTSVCTPRPGGGYPTCTLPGERQVNAGPMAAGFAMSGAGLALAVYSRRTEPVYQR
jgi:hypothetical protein